MESETEVLIAGAGPVGLALGLELQRFGIRFRIVEKKAGRSKTSKALGLQPRVSEVFAILGIKAEFNARGFGDIRAVNFHSGGRTLLRIALRPPVDQAGRDACQPQLLIIPQSETEEILERTLASRGNLVERRRELVEFVQGRDRVRALVRSETGGAETVVAQFLVSCEGAHSVVRKQAGFSFAGTTMPMRFLLADVAIDWDRAENEVQVWFHRDGVMGALPFGGQRWRLIIECAPEPAAEPQEVTLSLVQRLLAERVGADIGLRDPLWLSDFRINARMVDRFRDRRIFVAGDAAHIHSPLGGQGIATGIQDASNLAWKLAAVLRDGAPDSLLDTYEEERKPIARAVLRGTTAASRLVFGMNPILRFVRERMVFPILGTAFVQRRLFRRVSQLELRYRGRLTELSSGADFIRAGERAPDIIFRNKGRNISLFDLLGEFGLIALLGLGETSEYLVKSLAALRIRSFIVAPGHVEDVHADFARLYGAQGPFLCLIRPDGHVGLFQCPADAHSLALYLKKIRAAELVEKAFA
ncbi:MAG TPA: FAD-dependent monooxygenase [Chthoniobacterales bacterium]|nr:FAD-dependent monooxygenase [Chthoniobacterales bacterium]